MRGDETMALGGLRIRAFQTHDLEAIHDLTQRCFGVDRPMTAQAWRFTDTPAGLIPGMVALDGSRIVASYTAWPITLRMGSELVQGAQSMDTMTDPDYRGRGLFVALANETCGLLADLGYRLIYGFPNQQSLPGFIHRLGWKHIGHVPTFKRLNAPVLGLLSPFPMLSGRTWHGAMFRSRPLEFSREPVLFSDLANLAARHDYGGVRLQRDILWFRWRYSPASSYNYRVITASSEIGLEAAVMYRIDGYRAWLTETLGSFEALQKAITRCLQHMRQEGVKIVTALTTDPVAAGALKKAGFWHRGGEVFIVKRLSPQPLHADPYDLGNWILFGGDHDFY